jgi:hypothetical protein
MVLNYEQQKASKIMICKILKMGLKDGDLNRAMIIVDELFKRYSFRTEIYYELKKVLEKEFEIDPFTFYFIILKDIYELFQHGLVHLEIFIKYDEVV